jgi:hypothetical protein
MEEPSGYLIRGKQWSVFGTYLVSSCAINSVLSDYADARLWDWGLLKGRTDKQMNITPKPHSEAMSASPAPSQPSPSPSQPSQRRVPSDTQLMSMLDTLTLVYGSNRSPRRLDTTKQLDRKSAMYTTNLAIYPPPFLLVPSQIVITGRKPLHSVKKGGR